MDHRSSKLPLEAGLGGAAVVVAVGVEPVVGLEGTRDGAITG